MRTLTDHIVNGDVPQNQLRITVNDEPGHGGACHNYTIDWHDATKTSKKEHDPYREVGMDAFVRDPDDKAQEGFRTDFLINFQKGPIKEFGVNGITHEALLAILIDRLDSFQKGPFPSNENALALTHIRQALKLLQKRTELRIARGVEGTTQA